MWHHKMAFWRAGADDLKVIGVIPRRQLCRIEVPTRLAIELCYRIPVRFGRSAIDPSQPIVGILKAQFDGDGMEDHLVLRTLLLELRLAGTLHGLAGVPERDKQGSNPRDPGYQAPCNAQAKHCQAQG